MKFSLIVLILSGLLLASSSSHADLRPEEGRQRIEELKQELSLMITKAAAGLSDEENESEKTLFTHKLYELDQLRARYQALTITAPRPQTSMSNLATEPTERNLIYTTKEIPRTLETVSSFIMKSPKHAFVAFMTLDKVIQQDPDKRWSRNMADVGTIFLNAITEGTSVKNFSSLPSLLALLSFSNSHSFWFLEPISKNLVVNHNTGWPLLYELNEATTDAIISWIDTKPSRQDLFDFLLASKQHPFEWSGGSFTGFRSRDESRIFKSMLDNGYGDSAKDMILLTEALRKMGSHRAIKIEKYIDDVPFMKDLLKAFEKLNFETKILVVEDLFKRKASMSVADALQLFYHINKDLVFTQQQIKNLNEQFRLEPSNKALKKGIESYQQSLSSETDLLRWLTLKHLSQFKALGADRKEMQMYKRFGDVSILTQFLPALRPNTLPSSYSAGSGIRCERVFAEKSLFEAPRL